MDVGCSSTGVWKNHKYFFVNSVESFDGQEHTTYQKSQILRTHMDVHRVHSKELERLTFSQEKLKTK